VNLKSAFILLSISITITACSASRSADTASTVFAQPTPSILKAPTPPARRPDIELQKEIAEISKEAMGNVGVYATLIETGQNASQNADKHIALQSVVKVPIAMAVLKRVEEGTLDLDEKVGVTTDDFVPSNLRSPIRDKNPNGVELSVRDLIQFAISESDGTASDVLQRLAGGASGVQSYVDSLGINGMHIERTHKEFGEDWNKQYDNWATPIAVVELLKKLSVGEGISAENRELLLGFMTESENPHNRLKGMLPEGTPVAHKTGTGGTLNGVAAATNDVGIITLPNGKHIVIAVLVADSRANRFARASVIAKIALATFDKWSGVKPVELVKGANSNQRRTLNQTIQKPAISKGVTSPR